MKRKLIYLIAPVTVSLMLFTACSYEAVDADSEMVFVYKALFGKSGVDMVPGEGGSRIMTVWTTDVFRYNVQPVQYEEPFDDAITNNNTPVDLQGYLTLKIKKGKSPLLHQNFGVKWYENNIQAVFRELVRNQVSKYDMFTLTSDREVYEDINKEIRQELEAFIEKIQIPVEIINIIIGRAKPNQMGLDEMDRTAAQIQAAETQKKRKEAEDSREEAERSRAKADKAYRLELGLTSQEFIQLRQLEISKEYVEILRNKPNINVDLLINGGTTPIWDIKK